MRPFAVATRLTPPTPAKHAVATMITSRFNRPNTTDKNENASNSNATVTMCQHR